MSYKYIIGAARGDLLAISMKYNSHWYKLDGGFILDPANGETYYVTIL